MKQTASSLTEPIGTMASDHHTYGISSGQTSCISSTESITVAPGDELTAADHHAVRITVSTTEGFSDAETFTLRGAKAANTFARTLIAAAVRTYSRLDEESE